MVWVISCPAIALYLMYKNVRKAEDNKVKQYLLILYQGLKPANFYWEFVNTIRKVLLLVILVLSDSMKILFGVFILVGSARLQLHIRPYRDEENNKIELMAIIVGIVTLMATMIYNSEDSVDFLNVIVFIVIIFLNVQFLIEWVYKMILCASDRSKFFKLVRDF
jgi:glycerol uptake facilitator-like aquaporin